MVMLFQSPIADNKTSNSPAPIKTDTCTLLDGYARKLSSARAKIAVVGNILESTQVYLFILLIYFYLNHAILHETLLDT